jgi:hypothetical protein
MSTDVAPPAARTYPLARVMFWLAFADLLLIAGVVHRANHPEATRAELEVMTYGLLVLSPLIAIETWVAFLIRNRSVRPRGSTFIRALWITALPPLRMGMPCPFTGRLWLPTWGWCDRGKSLEDRLERAFYKPMLVFAILILPVLALELVRAEQIHSSPSLALTVHIGVSVIWMAFATEFAVRVSAARRPLAYTKQRWLDLAIVIVPMLEFALTQLVDIAPLARLLRLSRAVGPDQLARMGQMYRLRGLVTKGWRAILVLRVVARLTGDAPAKQLARLESQIADVEEVLADLRAQAAVLRDKACASPEPPAETSPALAASSEP